MKGRRTSTLNNNIPAMTPEVTHEYLYELGKNWSGKGIAMELGSWLGGSAVPLLKGLKEAGYNHKFWAFDRWQANVQQVEALRKKGIPVALGEDLRPRFVENVSQVYSSIKTVQGNMPMTLKEYAGDPIEICIFDAPKQEPVFTESIKTLYKYWIPGVTILGLLDYWFFKRHTDFKKRIKFEAPHKFMQKYGHHFTILKDFKTSEVFFRYEKELTL